MSLATPFLILVLLALSGFAVIVPRLTRLYEPESTHLDAPASSVEEIERWTAQVAVSRSTADTQH